VLTDDPVERARAASIVDATTDTTWDCLMLAVDFKGATVVVLPDGEGF
jgi:homoserine kinase